MSADPSPDLLGELRSRLRDREELLRKTLIEKGELALRQLEEARARRFEAEEAGRLDSLTGVLRHGPFRLRVAFEVGRSGRTGEPLGLVLVDLDQFGPFNRAHGYERGERVLAQLGRSLVSPWLARPANRPPVFGREGGDCFGVLLPGAAEAETGARAEELRDLVERLSLGGARLTASVGATSCASAPRSGEELLAAASAALAQARSEGGNRVRLRPLS